MKKLLLTITAIAVICSFTACSTNTENNGDSTSNSTQSSQNSAAEPNSAEPDKADTTDAPVTTDATNVTDDTPVTADTVNTTDAPAITDAPVTTNAANTTEKQENEPSEASLKDIEAAIANALGDGYLCTAEIPQEELILSCIGWLDMDKVDEYVVKGPAVFGQDAVGIVRCKAGYADEAVKTLNERFAQSIDYIRQYPFDVAKVEGTRIFKVGDIVMYITAGAPYDSGDKEEEAKLADAEYEKIDNAMKELFGSVPKNLAEMPTGSGLNAEMAR